MLIEEGAKTLLVPGNFPIGCSAVYLTIFRSPNKGDYDESNGCLKAFNAFAQYHDAQLKLALHKLRLKHPNAKIIYADYYKAAMPLFQAPRSFGEFLESTPSYNKHIINVLDFIKSLLEMYDRCRILQWGPKSLLWGRWTVQFQ